MCALFWTFLIPIIEVLTPLKNRETTHRRQHNVTIEKKNILFKICRNMGLCMDCVNEEVKIRRAWM